jgi:hypothetical protein
MPLRASTCQAAYTHPLLAYPLENYVNVRGEVPRDRPNHACRARRASVVSDTIMHAIEDDASACIYLLGSRHPLLATRLRRAYIPYSRLLAREVSVKPGAAEIALITHVARGVQA